MCSCDCPGLSPRAAPFGPPSWQNPMPSPTAVLPAMQHKKSKIEKIDIRGLRYNVRHWGERDAPRQARRGALARRSDTAPAASAVRPFRLAKGRVCAYHPAMRFLRRQSGRGAFRQRRALLPDRAWRPGDPRFPAAPPAAGFQRKAAESRRFSVRFKNNTRENTMLDTAIKGQLKAYLERLQRPIELLAALDDSPKGQEMRALLNDILDCSDKISLLETDTFTRIPSFAIGLPGETPRIHFAGLPMGHEFTSLVLALLQTGGHPPKVEQAVIDQIKALPGSFKFETYISLSCHNCPDVVQALNLMAVLNPNITSTMIDGAMFQDEVNARQIMAVPTTYLNDAEFGAGRMLIEEILAKVDTGAAARAAEELGKKESFDVLVVGGGPAGAADG
mgnify:CR=1 FL=1